MNITFRVIVAALPPQGKKSDKAISALQPLVDRFADELRVLAATSSEANPVTLDQVKGALTAANIPSSKKISELPLAVKPILVAALVEQAREAGITEFTNEHAIEVLKFPKNIMPVISDAAEPTVQDDPGLPRKVKPVAHHRAYLTLKNRVRDRVLEASGYIFRDSIDTEFLDGTSKGPELVVGNNYAIIILTENGNVSTADKSFRYKVQFLGKKDSNLRFTTLDSPPLKTLGRHIAFINVDVNEPPFTPEVESPVQVRVDTGRDEYIPDPEILSVINRNHFSRVFSGGKQN